jgi:hypothetical protein
VVLKTHGSRADAPPSFKNRTWPLAIVTGEPPTLTLEKLDFNSFSGLEEKIFQPIIFLLVSKPALPNKNFGPKKFGL